ncbi:NADPH-dependent FMN reductase [Microbacterium mangrovi]|uniref:NADPH-dependent FMN reductase n=1 Tax=Microbacterium mangrovi TaxID=1348253 RepID=A0A0B2A4W8_9MICO|nr:NAD(P)H-dependent oxidoreductase [Microbacterium mangrovi]KHK96618.1 NADPH-dependent FMN reductase [Microbacterium mangrovi]
MTTITVLVGNPQRASRTRQVAEEVAAALARRSGSAVDPTIELADVAPSLFTFPAPEIDSLLERVANSTVLVVASPTYKATYTGLLKAFLDRYGSDALGAVTAVPVLTIGSPAHALAVEVALRPLLVELGASVPTRGLAFPASSIDDREQLIDAWADDEWPRIAHALPHAV